MGLITKTVMVKWHGTNKKWYISQGYKFTKIGDEFEIKVENLSKSSGIKVQVKCDGCDKILNINWCNYLKFKHNNTYYCQRCGLKLFGNKNKIKKHLQNGQSFYDWCYENLDKKQADKIIKRWDYEKNKCSPKEVCYSSGGFNHKGYYFKCMENPKHKSELHSINKFIYRQKNNLECKQCNSFAEYLIDTYGNNALDLYWDYNKNKNIDPWEITKSANKNIWIKCQEKDYHDSYKVRCSRFIEGSRCPYCCNFHGKVHPKDSLGQTLKNKGLLGVWSEKNERSPFEIAPNVNKKFWWKCPDGKHDDYLRNGNHSLRSNFRCPQCEGYSKGEEKIDNYLIKNKINYEAQKTFDGLIGLGDGLLSYDFYLPQYNLLIEYQGIQHEKPVDFKGKGLEYAKKEFKKQKEHDKLKREYAKEHNIKLLEIWYNCFDDIDFILDEVLKELNHALDKYEKFFNKNKDDIIRTINK